MVIIGCLLSYLAMLLCVGWFLRRILGSEGVDHVTDSEVYPTWGCDLNCPTCLQRKFPDKFKGSLTPGQFTAFLDGLERQHHVIRTLEFNGGEPTTWPHLSWAVQEVRRRGLARKIVILTNAVHRKPEDFAGFDLVRVTDYGALNAKDILRLKAGLPRKRLRVSRVIHRESEIDGPQRSRTVAWPALCASPGINLGPDGKVYSCGNSVIEEREGLDPSTDFVAILRERDVFRQERCRNCPSNHRFTDMQYGDKDLLGLIVEFKIWGTPLGFLWHFPRLNWWRWRYLRSRYYRRIT